MLSPFHKLIKSNISMLINKSKDVITDPKTVADMLQNQFLSVFSDPTSLNIKEPDFPVPDILTPGENYIRRYFKNFFRFGQWTRRNFSDSSEKLCPRVL